ncbi:DUF1653 domain-containing protein [Granulosicoccus antarcticus]|uniref:DUF1653 domain-containing protein n=1 Tax=Granulosicoccus antarcticus IMCC3135 TaxID=1192854 RepID=A0A2Z2NV89_9GAMM|nr:DUF1653 domain-containing protein [Granulosicoccus antarcticus]ASJ75239.1 hypothetical protein IMCC3135_25920 [Granulosicoccus antarcticus IMCC3135]
MKMEPEKSLAPANAPVPGIYRHYKGSQYQVLGMARHSETEEWLVVYQALYAERGFWLRPLSLWLEPVTVNSDDSNHASRAEKPTIRFELVEKNANSLSSVIETG